MSAPSGLTTRREMDPFWRPVKTSGAQLTSKLYELALQLGNAANGERFICGCYQLFDCPAVRKFVGLNAIATHNNNEERVVSFSEKIFQSDRSAFRCMRVR